VGHWALCSCQVSLPPSSLSLHVLSLPSGLFLSFFSFSSQLYFTSSSRNRWNRAQRFPRTLNTRPPIAHFCQPCLASTLLGQPSSLPSSLASSFLQALQMLHPSIRGRTSLALPPSQHNTPPIRALPSIPTRQDSLTGVL
jgi:hypothetical protein